MSCFSPLTAQGAKTPSVGTMRDPRRVSSLKPAPVCEWMVLPWPQFSPREVHPRSLCQHGQPWVGGMLLLRCPSQFLPRLHWSRALLVWPTAVCTAMVAPALSGHDFKFPQPTCGRPCGDTLWIIHGVKCSYCMANIYNSHLPKHQSPELPPPWSACHEILCFSANRLLVASKGTWYLLGLGPSWLTMRSRLWSPDP